MKPQPKVITRDTLVRMATTNGEAQNALKKLQQLERAGQMGQIFLDKVARNIRVHAV